MMKKSKEKTALHEVVYLAPSGAEISLSVDAHFRPLVMERDLIAAIDGCLQAKLFWIDKNGRVRLNYRAIAKFAKAVDEKFYHGPSGYEFLNALTHLGVLMESHRCSRNKPCFVVMVESEASVFFRLAGGAFNDGMFYADKRVAKKMLELEQKKHPRSSCRLLTITNIKE